MLPVDAKGLQRSAFHHQSRPVEGRTNHWLHDQPRERTWREHSFVRPTRASERVMKVLTGDEDETHQALGQAQLDEVRRGCQNRARSRQSASDLNAGRDAVERTLAHLDGPDGLDAQHATRQEGVLRDSDRCSRARQPKLS